MDYGKIYICTFIDASAINYVPSWKQYGTEVVFTKYDIKETDMRVKTASFTSPTFYDLTTGKYAIFIQSKYHENFSGIVLDVEYDEDTKLYTYQCQDWSRQYISKCEIWTKNTKLYNILLSLISKGWLSLKATPSQRKQFQAQTSGLKNIGVYNQAIYPGNIYSKNPMVDKISLISRDKSWIEVIRALVFSRAGYFDIWFNDKGILQIEAISKTDWENTGLVLSDNNYYDRKFKFSTTNAITKAIFTNNDISVGDSVTSEEALGLDLTVFFGSVVASTQNPFADSQTTNSTSTSTKTTTKTNSYNNPFMNKPKKVWINADNGSNSMKNQLASALKKNGWSVKIGATNPNAHYSDYFNVGSNYVYVTVYNGFCAGTIREAYSSKIQNVLKKKNVQLVVVFDTAGWTNPNGMKPYRYGDFSKYNAKRAWDDNFSNSDPSIKNVGDFFKKNKAVYCASPTLSEILKQFNAGGYFKYKGIKV